LNFWWGFWIISNIVSNLSFRLSLKAEDLDELLTVTKLDIAAGLLDIPLTLITISVIKQMSQVEKELGR